MRRTLASRAARWGKPFSPLHLPGLKLWFDASDASTISVATGVSQWRDKSGQSNHALQATGAKQPTVAVEALNGKNTLAFAAASQQALDLTSLITAVGDADEWSVFGVVRRASTATSLVTLGSSDGPGALGYAVGIFISSHKMQATSPGKAAVSTPGFTDTSSYHPIGVVHRSDGTFDLYYDGALIGDAESATTRRSNWGCVGAGLGDGDIYCDGDIAELIYCDKAFNVGLINDVHSYFARSDRWAL